MEKEKVSIDLEDGRTVVLILDYIDEIETNEITSIDYGNIMGEFLTCSRIINSVGNLRAGLQNFLAKEKLKFEIWWSQAYDEKASGDTKRPTKEMIEAHIKRLPEYKKHKTLLNQVEYKLSLTENLYWSLREKDAKLEKLFGSLKPEEFNKELIEGQVNKCMVRIKTSSISR